mmetsp:Transcript_4701/g.29660  ORF Transcript_4701/g.29660 Transcript_4701/m.29660 type:complete len:115 (-) Transcript_4701:160-504(-)
MTSLEPSIVDCACQPALRIQRNNKKTMGTGGSIEALEVLGCTQWKVPTLCKPTETTSSRESHFGLRKPIFVSTERGLAALLNCGAKQERSSGKQCLRASPEPWNGHCRKHSIGT